MLKLVAIVVALGVFANAQSPCCFPSQYEGGWSGVGAELDGDTNEADAVRTINFVSIDSSDNDKILYHGYTISTNLYTRVRDEYSVLVKDGVAYTYNDTSCVSKAAERPEFVGCITDSAQFRGTTYLGEGDHTLQFHVWRLSFTNTTATVTVTDKCIPLSYDSAGRSGNTKFAQAAAFIGFTAGIRDRSVFDIPSYCSA